MRELYRVLPFAGYTRVVGLLALLMTLAFVVPSMAEDITIDYTFEAPLIEQVEIGGQVYHRLTMPLAPSSGMDGEPSLPAMGARVLLPVGSVVGSIDVVGIERTSLGADFLVEPVARPVILSAPPGSGMPPAPDAAIYQSDEPFPGERHENIGVQSFRGYRYVTLKLHPVEYIPASGELYYYSRLRVTVHTIDGGAPSEMLRNLTVDRATVATKVDNPELLAKSFAPPLAAAGNYDLLILTTPTLAASFQSLKDHHDSAGILTEIHTTDEVGSNAPDDVRDYIRERYLNDGIKYVLIGADDDLIPAKDLYVKSWDGSDAEIETRMPGDIYFACLDGTYNYDGDSFAGEPNDGEGGGNVDLTAEVYVGRASVGTTTEANRFVTKTLWYASCMRPYLENVLMCGEHLGFGGVSDYAGNTMDQIIDGSSADGYTTVGLPTEVYNIDKLYDRDWTNHSWPTSELISRINAGRHIINHLGHGNTGWALKMTSSQAGSLVNSDLLFLYSQACLSGHFDGMDCWAEYLHVKNSHGAFAVIMNARYGWGTENSTDGPSQRFNRQFWDAIFNPVENKPMIGRANQDSKEDNLYRINQSCMRWCYYEITLFGDPTLTFSEGLGVLCEFPEGFPTRVSPGDTTRVEMTVSGMYDGEPMPASGQLHYSLNGGPLQTVDMTEISTDHYETYLPVVFCGDELEYYFSACESQGERFYYPSPDNPRTVDVATGVYLVLVDDFEYDKNWVVSGDATDGHWERGWPNGSGDRGDPTSDYDGSRKCYLTGNAAGDSDVDNGTTTLTSSSFGAIEGDVKIRYARWFSNVAGGDESTDVFRVWLSNDDGATWTLADSAGPEEQASGGWYETSFWVDDILPGAAQMRLRFEASDLGDGSVIEAAVDAVAINRIECIDWICGDINGDRKINLADISRLISYVYLEGTPPEPLEAGNVNATINGAINLADISQLISYVYLGGNELMCL